jgi:hypothetical protein
MSVEVAEAGRQLARVSPQRWSLSFAALLAATAATIATGAASGSPSVFAIVLVAGLAGLAVGRPATHTALSVFVVVIWYWLAAVDDPVTPWAMAVSVALFAFHTIVALLATTPTTATVDRTSVRRWLVRSLTVATTIVATWGLVAAFDRRSSPGTVGSTALALVVVLALVVALRSALPPPDHDD